MPRRGDTLAHINRLSGDIHLAEGRKREAAECYRAAILMGDNGPAEAARLDALAAGAAPDWAKIAEQYRNTLAKTVTERPGEDRGPEPSARRSR
jgi:hypothetical protein